MWRAARGWARPAAMRSRAVPKVSCAFCRAAIRMSSGCRSLKPARCSVRPACRLTEWIIEAGLGETRAALVEDGRIVEARVARAGEGPRVGALPGARLVALGTLLPVAPGAPGARH